MTGTHLIPAMATTTGGAAPAGGALHEDHQPGAGCTCSGIAFSRMPDIGHDQFLPCFLHTHRSMTPSPHSLMTTTGREVRDQREADRQVRRGPGRQGPSRCLLVRSNGGKWHAGLIDNRMARVGGPSPARNNSIHGHSHALNNTYQPLPCQVSPTDIEEGMRVGVDRTKYSIQIPLPPKIDPTVSLMTVEDKPDVTYDEARFHRSISVCD